MAFHKEQIAKLQRVQNAAARLIMDIGKHCHITPALYGYLCQRVYILRFYYYLLKPFTASHPHILAIFWLSNASPRTILDLTRVFY